MIQITKGFGIRPEIQILVVMSLGAVCTPGGTLPLALNMVYL